MYITNVLFITQSAKIFYREATCQNCHDEKVPVLLLHGLKFTSKTWLDLQTIKTVAEHGYHVIAVDLPSKGNSDAIPNGDKLNFISQFIKAIGFTKPAIVVPSYAGTFAIPYLLNMRDDLSGLMTIAPSETELLVKYSCKNASSEVILTHTPEYLKSLVPKDMPNLSCIKTPVLNTHGEFDRAKSVAILSTLPNSRTFEFAEADHAAYLKRPKEFHTLLIAFLNELNKTI